MFKHIPLLLLFFTFLLVDAQRRTTPKSDDVLVESPRPPSRGRGRSRFTATQEYLQISEPLDSSSEEPSRKLVSARKRLHDLPTERRVAFRPTEPPLTRAYEVEELVNESPIESFKRTSKPRLLTEARFEAKEAPRKNALELPSPLTDLPDLFRAPFRAPEGLTSNALPPENLSSQSTTATEASTKSSLPNSSEQLVDATSESSSTELPRELQALRQVEYKGDLTRSIPVVTSPKSAENRRAPASGRRGAGRSRLDNSVTEGTTTTRSRSRTRATKKPTEIPPRRSLETPAPSPSPRTAQRGPRRRIDTSTPLFEPSRKGPSVFGAETAPSEARSRHGRRIYNAAPEKVTLDLNTSSSRRQDINRKRTASTTTQKPDELRRRSTSRVQSRDVPTSRTSPSRSRSKFTPFSGFIDEQNLEVLPLFESEPKTVRPVSRSRSRSSTNSEETRDRKLTKSAREPRTRSRSRTSSGAVSDSYLMSATETEMKFTKPNDAPFKVSISTEGRTEPTRSNSIAQKQERQTPGPSSRKPPARSDPPRQKPVSLRQKADLLEKSTTRSKAKSTTEPNHLRQNKVVLAASIQKTVTESLQRTATNLPSAKQIPNAREDQKVVHSVPRQQPAQFRQKLAAEPTLGENKEGLSLPRQQSAQFRQKPVTETSLPKSTAQTSSKEKPVTQTVSAVQDSSNKRPQIKETVVVSPQITEVTSKRTVYRKRNNGDLVVKKIIKPIGANSRGTKKSEVRVSKGRPGGADDIDESDNYPEPFKALIQAKKKEQELRSQLQKKSSVGQKNDASGNAIVIVTPSYVTPTIVTVSSHSTEAVSAKEINDEDNELEPRSQSISTRTTPPFKHISGSTPPRTTSTPYSTITTSRAATTSRTATSRATSRPTTVRSVQTRPTRVRATSRSSVPTTNLSLRRQLQPRKSSKVVRSTAQPPSTTPLSREPTAERSGISNVEFKPRGSSNWKRVTEEGSGESKERVDGSGSLSTKIPKPTIYKKPSRTKYRSDISQRGAVARSTTNPPVYIPTIPSLPYIPTVPTVTPSTRTTVYAGAKDPDLGLEIISFDDPVISRIPSANLVDGDFISSSENVLLQVVKDGTTEKPVSIIERIINSITAINATSSTTDPSKITTPKSTAESSSAILKLANKKSKNLDNTKIDVTLQTGTVSYTTEKPTTIIERILNSLSAIQATDDTNSVQVGKDFNTISASTTTPIPRVTKSATSSTPSAQSSTSFDPLSILDEITPQQALQKRTIGQLLDILNGMLSTTETQRKLVVVTPKTSSFVNEDINSVFSSFGSSEISSITSSPAVSNLPSSEPSVFTSAPLSLSASSSETVNELFTSPNKDIDNFAGTSTENVLYYTEPTSVEPQTISTEFTTSPQGEITTNAPTIFTTDLITSPTLITTESTTNTFPSTTEAGLDNSTKSTISLYTLLSTLPSLQKFEVSPGSVSVFSANDLSNAITPDDNLPATVTIASRSNFDNTATTQSSTTVQSSTTTDGVFTTTFGSADTDTSTLTSTEEDTTNPKVTNEQFLEGLLNPVEQNSIDISTPDYFVFAILNNNTILRKRPPTIPNRDTPFVIVGVYPNNTIVRKFPNGTLVPMEQIIRVRGFDTRENPPPLPEITSNQVTNEPGRSPIVQTVAQNTVPTIEANPLSLQSTSTLLGTTTSAPLITTSTSSDLNSTTISSTTEFTSPSPSSTTPAASSTDTVSVVSTLSSTTTEGSTTPGTNSSSTTVGTTLSGISSTTVESSTAETVTLPTLSELLNGRTLEDFNNIISSSSTHTEPTNYKTLQLNQYNKVLNIQDLLKGKNENEDVVYRWKPVTSTNSDKVDITTPDSPLGNTVSTTIFTPTTLPSTVGTIVKKITQVTPTTRAPVTSTSTTLRIPTFTTTTTTRAPTTRFTSTPVTTSLPSRTTTARRTTTTTYPRVTSSTVFPVFLSTLFPTLFPTTTETIRITTGSPATTTGIPTTSYDSANEIFAFASSTQQPTTVRAPRSRKPKTTTLPPSTTVVLTTTTEAATTTTSSTTREPSTSSAAVTDLNTVVTTSAKTPKLKELTEEQKKNLQTLANLEREQAALLRQLSLLTSLGFGGGAGTAGAKPQPSSANLANRVIQLAVDRDKSKTAKPTTKITTEEPSTTVRTRRPKKSTTTKSPTSIQDQLATIGTAKGLNAQSPSIEEVLKQYNLSGLDIVTTPKSTSYGKSDDAVLAALLKEQGISPPTPKSLEGIFENTTRRPRKSKTTTQRPPGARLMQGLSWLLNVLNPPPPPTTRKPKPKKPKKSKAVDQQELLANSPTHITPVVTSPPSTVANSLSQDDIQKLIKQLEGLKEDPSKGALDLTQIKSLQNLINTDEGVQVITNGEHGATSRRSTTRKPKSTASGRKKPRQSTTEAPTSTLSNSVDEIDEDFVSTTAKKPIGFRPVPGVDDDTSDPFIRSNLITAAVNVTRAITGFLGSALQGAAHSFQSLLGSGSRLAGSGSRLAGSFAQGSSAGQQNEK